VSPNVSDPELLQHIADAEAGFPCYELIPDQMIAEDDLVAVRAVFRGVHRGPFAVCNPRAKRFRRG